MCTWCEVRNFVSQKFRLTPDPGSLLNFGNSRNLRGPFLSKNGGKLRMDRLLAGFGTVVGFSNFKNAQTCIRIQNF